MQQYTPNIGNLIAEDEAAYRDAIHFAVAPLVAATRLYPGDYFRLNDHKEAVFTTSRDETSIGIVDPFLTVAVQIGQKFWGILKPNTITGLRHLWNHPAFAPASFVPKEQNNG